MGSVAETAQWVVGNVPAFTSGAQMVVPPWRATNLPFFMPISKKQLLLAGWPLTKCRAGDRPPSVSPVGSPYRPLRISAEVSDVVAEAPAAFTAACMRAPSDQDCNTISPKLGPVGTPGAYLSRAAYIVDVEAL